MILIEVIHAQGLQDSEGIMIVLQFFRELVDFFERHVPWSN
jgi:hypothetical protein